MTDIGPDAARMLWARKAVNPDGTTRNGFRWPIGVGGWVEQDGPADGEACGEGLHLGLTVAGLSSVHRLSESTLLAVGWLPEDELGRDGDKVRVRRCWVAPGWHTSLPLVLRNGCGTDANLARASLARADLAEANLARAYLAEADLTDADLTDADLTDADLTDADLTDADLTDANLTRAYLVRADLTEANLTDANLTRAYLVRADLTGANLTGANLTGARVGWSSDTPRPSWLPSGWTVVDGLIEWEDR